MSKKSDNWRARGEWGSSSGRAPRGNRKGCAAPAAVMLAGAIATAYGLIEGIRAVTS